MKTYKALAITGAAVVCLLIFGFRYIKHQENSVEKEMSTHEKGCVFRTVMGEEASDDYARYKTPEDVLKSIDRGLSWMMKAQNKNGGWGAGTHARQDITDPHAVHPDPATTAMVAMSMLRTGNTLRFGTHSEALSRALQYLLGAVETSTAESPTITSERGTQIQSKLGENIDVILTAQFLSNVLEYADHDGQLKDRIRSALNKCVQKIERNQQHDGSTAGAGWAGVLQSAFATSALESAEANGAVVDTSALQKAKSYQVDNYNAKTGEAKTDMGAGVVLYSVTGSARASAKDARKVKEDLEKAKREGRLAQGAPVNVETLRELGYSPDNAVRGVTSYEVYQSSTAKAQEDAVMNGFGSNGGEEFLSYLQTGESLVINKDESWHNWFNNISGRLIKIQNESGNWSGHHCITSPVFCTATCLLILSVNNDIDKLTDVGKR